MTLKTRNAIVTGSTSGIGLAIARGLAAEGANVVINGFGDADAIEKERKAIEKDFGVKSIYSPADGTKPDAVRGMVKQAEADLGSVDVAEGRPFACATPATSSNASTHLMAAAYPLARVPHADTCWTCADLQSQASQPTLCSISGGVAKNRLRLGSLKRL